MTLFALFQDTGGIYHACDKINVLPDETSENAFIVQDQSVMLIAYNDNKAILDNLCSNLNSQSPRVKVSDAERMKKSIDVTNKSTKSKNVLLDSLNKSELSTVKCSKISTGNSCTNLKRKSPHPKLMNIKKMKKPIIISDTIIKSKNPRLYLPKSPVIIDKENNMSIGYSCANLNSQLIDPESIDIKETQKSVSIPNKSSKLKDFTHFSSIKSSVSLNKDDIIPLNNLQINKNSELPISLEIINNEEKLANSTLITDGDETTGVENLSFDLNSGSILNITNNEQTGNSITVFDQFIRPWSSEFNSFTDLPLMTDKDDTSELENFCSNLNSEILFPDLKNNEQTGSLVDNNEFNVSKILHLNSSTDSSMITREENRNDESMTDMNNSDSLYQPSGNEQDSEDMSVAEKSATTNNTSNLLNNDSNVSSEGETSFSNVSVSLSLSFNVPGNSACDDTSIKTELSKGSKKKNFCYYCKKFQSQLARHLIGKHSDENDVKKICSLAPNTLERRKEIEKIRKKGNFLLLVDKNLNKGVVVPVRRPQKGDKCSGVNFAVCPSCMGLYTKNNIRHHLASCSGQDKTIKAVLMNARATVGRIHARASIILRQQVLPHMREDDIVRLIRYDLLIILYGNQLCLKHRKRHMHKLIRANLRLCGRFLFFMQQKEKRITDFASLYDPTNYHLMIDCIDEFAGIDGDTGLYSKTGNATEISKHIIKIGAIYVTECIIHVRPDIQKKIEDFISLCKAGFSNITNKTAMESLVARQREKIVELPLTSDIQRLSQYLDQLIDENYKALKSNFSHSSWRTLAEAVLTQVQVFNRRRPGELERLTLSDFGRIQKITEEDEEYQYLSKEEKEAAKEYMRIVMRGKLNRSVPMLLNNRWYEAIKMIVKYRRQAGISKKNVYVFGIQGQEFDSCLSATALMNKFSKSCDASKPKTLRATPLRKHAATKCVQFGLDETKTGHVANFLGHDIKIHKNIYRQPVAKIDIVGISKVLEKAQNLADSDNKNYDDSRIDSENDDENIGNTTKEYNSTMDDSENTSVNNDTLDSFTGTENLHIKTTKDFSKSCKTRWSKEEIKMVKKHFSEYLTSKQLPSLPYIRNIQYKYKILTNRQPQVIKAWINNQNTSVKRKNDLIKKSFSDQKVIATYDDVRIKKHVKRIFNDYIKKNSLPSLRTCSEKKKGDKVLISLTDKEIQRIIKKMF